MKILQIVSEYPPLEGYGVARYVSEMARSLGDLGHEVHILVADAVEAAPPPADGTPVHFLHEKYPFFGYNAYLDTVLNSVPCCERLVDLWDRSGPFDVVVGHGWSSSLAATMAQRLYSCPLVATLHGTQAGAAGAKGTAEQIYVAEMERWFAGRADRVVVLSEFGRGEVERHCDVPAQKIDVIPGGVSARTFGTEVDHGDFRSMFAEPDEKIILFVGRLVPEKGPDVLLAAMKSLGNHSPGIRAVLAGDGPMKESLIAESDRRGLKEHVRIAGYLGPTVLGALYQVADVLAIPSRYDDFGWTVLEGALHDLPVVASQCGGLSELARVLPTGAMIPAVPGDAQSLAAGLSRVLKGKGSEKRNPRPLQKRVPGSFAWENLAQRTAALYQSLPVAVNR
jgi:glycosyltransferase involved in cell wall biosynthesis